MKSNIPDADLSRLRSYIASVRWQFAKTMPQWPHWYTIRDWSPGKEKEYDFFAEVIQKYGFVDPWFENRWHYLVVDEFKYWALDEVLNRADPRSNSDVIKDGEKYLEKMKRKATSKKSP